MIKSRAYLFCFITACLAIILTVAYNETAMAAEVDNISSGKLTENNSISDDENVVISSYYSQGDYNSFYYNQLDSYAKIIYDKLLTHVEEMKNGDYTINVLYDTATVKEEEVGTFFQSAIDAFDRDHPEIFWLSLNRLQLSYSVLNYNGVNYVKNVKIGLVQTEQVKNNSYLLDEYSDNQVLQNDIDMFKTRLSLITSQVMNDDEYQTIKNIHDLIVLSNDYNSSENMSLKAYKSISAIIGNIGNDEAPVCEGYARAVKVICDNLEIPCVIASGNATLNGETIGHMWNCVLINGHWYYVDATWDDPILSEGKNFDDLSQSRKYAFFLKGTEMISSTHSQSGMFADKMNYNFYFRYPLMSKSDYGENNDYYKIVIKRVSGGNVSTNADDVIDVEAGTQINVYAVADLGMELVPSSLRYNDEIIVDNSFIMPSEDIVITAKFMKSDVDINISNEENNVSDSKQEPESVTDVPTEQTSSANLTTQSNQTTQISATEISATDISTQLPTDGKTSTTKKPNISSNIVTDHSGNMPSMKYSVKITNYSNISEDEKILQYHVTEGMFDEEVSVVLDECNIDENIAGILNKKFSNDTLIETNVFSMKIFGKEGNELDLKLSTNQEFIIYVPVSKEFADSEGKVRLYYLDGNKLIVTNADICEYKGTYYYQIYFENVGTYVLIEELGKIQETINSDTPLSNTTHNTLIEDEALSDNNTLYISIAFLVVGGLLLTLIVIRKRKRNMFDLEESKSEVSNIITTDTSNN